MIFKLSSMPNGTPVLRSPPSSFPDFNQQPCLCPVLNLKAVFGCFPFWIAMLLQVIHPLPPQLCSGVSKVRYGTCILNSGVAGMSSDGDVKSGAFKMTPYNK
jgi:hypothetical protein